MSKQAKMPQLYTRASVMPATYKPEDRTVEITWSTGAQVRRIDWWDGEPYMEELSLDPNHVRMGRMESGAPVLKDHWGTIDNVIGVVERGWIEDGEGRALVRFAKDEDSEAVMEKVKDGILRNISVGYQVHEYEIELPKTKGDMPTYRAIDWEPFEVSMVAIPADPSAQIRSQDSLHPVILTTRGIAMSEPEVTAPVEEAQAPEAQAPVETQAETIDAADVATRAVQAERERVFAIRDAVRLAKLDDGIADEMIRSGKSLDQCRDDIWRRWADRVDATATQPNHSEPAYDKRSAEIAATLLKQVSGVK